MLRRSLFALLGACALLACAPAPAAEARDVSITLARSACFGSCPTYRVTINGDGAVVYQGSSSVGTTGRQTAQIEPAAVAALVRRFDEIGFDNLRDEYRGGMTDIPTYTITLVRDGRTKRVVDYGGLSAGMPRAVRELQDEIDRVANTSRWVLRDGRPVHDPPPM